VNSLRVGLSGCGPAGLSVVQQVRLHQDCDIVVVHDRQMAEADRLAIANSIGFGTDDFARMIAYGVDFVVLAGPLEDRLAQVRLAAEQSVPCLVHAPLAADLDTARAIVDAAVRAEIRLGVVVPGQADPVLEQLRRMIGADWLGGVVGVQAIIGDDELLRAGSVTHRADPFTSLAAQHVHLAAWLTGRRAAQVTAQTTRTFRPDLDDGGAATVVLRGGVLCTFLASRLTRTHAFAIHGTDGGLRIAGDRILLTGKRPFQGHVFDYVTPGIEMVIARKDLRDAIAQHAPGSEPCGRFAGWLEDVDDFPCPAEQAIVDLEVVDAMVRAAATGRTVAL
jgi:predicted dehydrogenase